MPGCGPQGDRSKARKAIRIDAKQIRRVAASTPIVEKRHRCVMRLGRAPQRDFIDKRPVEGTPA
jgi:hypothetical protein